MAAIPSLKLILGNFSLLILMVNNESMLFDESEAEIVGLSYLCEFRLG